jgi:hypothetical protein
MLYIRVEIWPGGDRSKAVVKGEAVIANDGTGTEVVGNYNAFFSKLSGFANPRYPKAAEVWKKGRVVDFPRRTLGPFHLLAVALASAVADVVGVYPSGADHEEEGPQDWDDFFSRFPDREAPSEGPGEGVGSLQAATPTETAPAVQNAAEEVAVARRWGRK